MEHKGPANLQRMKLLVGTWEGKHKRGDAEATATLTYAVTAGGSALVETLFPGTDEEMVSVYYDRDGKLNMTHYCRLGNQPVFEKTDSSGGILFFSLKDSQGISAPNEAHMHDLKLEFVSPDSIVQTWTLFDEGISQGETVFTLARKA